MRPVPLVRVVLSAALWLLFGAQASAQPARGKPNRSRQPAMTPAPNPAPTQTGKSIASVYAQPAAAAPEAQPAVAAPEAQPAVAAAPDHPRTAPVVLPPEDHPGLSERANHHNTFGMTLLAGFGGDAVLADETLSLEPAAGVTLRYEIPANAFFVVGLFFAPYVWQPSADASANVSRSGLIDVSLYPKLRLPLSRMLELYVSVPIGGTMDLGDDETFGGKTGVALGWNVWALLGAHVYLTPTTGLIFEAGGALHKFSHDVDPEVGSKVTVDSELRQVVVTFGFFAHS